MRDFSAVARLGACSRRVFGVSGDVASARPVHRQSILSADVDLAVRDRRHGERDGLSGGVAAALVAREERVRDVRRRVRAEDRRAMCGVAVRLDPDAITTSGARPTAPKGSGAADPKSSSAASRSCSLAASARRGSARAARRSRCRRPRVGRVAAREPIGVMERQRDRRVARRRTDEDRRARRRRGVRRFEPANESGRYLPADRPIDVRFGGAKPYRQIPGSRATMRSASVTKT